MSVRRFFWVLWGTLRDLWWELSGEYVDDSDSRNWNFWNWHDDEDKEL